MDAFLHSLTTVFNALPYIAQGAFVTIVMVAGALSLGFLLGLPLAVAQVYAPRPVRMLVGLYVWFFRGVPVLLLLFLFYFGLFNVIGLDLGMIGSSCAVLGLASAAYQSQIFRGSIQSLPSGQFKAGRALGMTDMQCIRSVVLPQALRISIPAWSNEYSILLKDSAMCFALGTPEIMAVRILWPPAPMSTFPSTSRRAASIFSSPSPASPFCAALSAGFAFPAAPLRT